VSLKVATLYINLSSGLQASEDKRSRKEIAEIAGVTAVTILQTYKLMFPHASKLFPEFSRLSVPIDQLPQK
jgi:transcription initiation factor TFIIB